MPTKPGVHVGLSQAPDVYELTFVNDETQVSYFGTLSEFDMLADAIKAETQEQRVRDRKIEPRPLIDGKE